MAKSKKEFTFLTIALFCSSLAHAQQQTPTEQKDTIENRNTIIKMADSHSSRGGVNNALDVLSGQAAGVNVTSNGLDRMAMLNSVRVRGTTSIIGGNDPLVLISSRSMIFMGDLWAMLDNSLHFNVNICTSYKKGLLNL